MFSGDSTIVQFLYSLSPRCWYRAGRLLYHRLDPEGRCTDVLEAEILDNRPGDDPELAEASDFGGLHELELGIPKRLGATDPYVPVDEILLAKVLKSLWFNEGGSAARGAVADEAAFGRAAGLTGAQAQLIPGRGEFRQALGKLNPTFTKRMSDLSFAAG